MKEKNKKINKKMKFGLVFGIIFVLITSVFTVGEQMNKKENTTVQELSTTKNITDIGEENQENLGFTENRGQIENDDVKYYVEGKGIWLLKDGVVFDIQKPSDENNYPDLKLGLKSICEFNTPISQEGVVLKLNFNEANSVDPIGQNELSYKSNYFFGEESDKWQKEISNYHEVIYPNIYDNIDLVYRITKDGLKYDFIVYPGGKPSDIKMRYEGVQELTITPNSDLEIHTEIGSLKDSNLFIYQNLENEEYDQIEGSFKLIDTMTYGFELQDEYDIDKVLIIDPFMELEYSTFVGGSSNDGGMDIVIDSEENVYVTGVTYSPNFPTTPGVYGPVFMGNTDVFVFKLDPTGTTLIYSTFVGGSGADFGYGITIDSLGCAFVTGKTGSSLPGIPFPTTPGVFGPVFFGGVWDVFVFELDPMGSTLLYSTYVGGDHDDIGWDIKVDSDGCAYVTGETDSPNFPTGPGYDISYNGQLDVFVFELDPIGSWLLYSTFIGGYADESGRGIALNPNREAFITGYTTSPAFPTTGGAYDTSHNGNEDVFVLELDSSGTVLFYSTFVGSDYYERGHSIVINGADCAYVTGFTNSINFPTTVGAYDTTWNGGKDVFVFELDPIGSTLFYSTFVGGTHEEEGYDIAIDPKEKVYVTGYTGSSDFPTTPEAYDTTWNGFNDVFVFKLDQTGSDLIFSTYVGGEYFDEGYGIAIDSFGNSFVTGETDSPNFPTTSSAYDTTWNGGSDVFVFKIHFAMMKHWILGQYPDLTWLEINDPSQSAIINFNGEDESTFYTITMTVSYELETYNVGGIGENLGLFPLGVDWYYLEFESDEYILINFHRDASKEDGIVLYGDDLLARPFYELSTDYYFSNRGAGSGDAWTVIYAPQTTSVTFYNIQLWATWGQRSPLPKVLNNINGLYICRTESIWDDQWLGMGWGFSVSATNPIAIAQFKQYSKHGQSGFPPVGSLYRHGWNGIQEQYNCYLDVKTNPDSIYGLYTTANTISYYDNFGSFITSDTYTSTYKKHIYFKNKYGTPYTSNTPYFVEVHGNSPFTSDDLPTINESIAYNATYFGFNPLHAKLYLANVNVTLPNGTSGTNPNFATVNITVTNVLTGDFIYLSILPYSSCAVYDVEDFTKSNGDPLFPENQAFIMTVNTIDNYNLTNLPIFQKVTHYNYGHETTYLRQYNALPERTTK